MHQSDKKLNYWDDEKNVRKHKADKKQPETRQSKHRDINQQLELWKDDDDQS